MLLDSWHFIDPTLVPSSNQEPSSANRSNGTGQQANRRIEADFVGWAVPRLVDERTQDGGDLC
jgi:hypothetical protein